MAKWKFKRKRKVYIKPKVKICENCKKRRVLFHHYLCNACHKLKHENKIEEEVKEF